MGYKPATAQQPNNCFSEENFQKVYDYLNKQISINKAKFIPFKGYNMYLDNESKRILVKENNYTLAIIHQKDILSLNKSAKHNHKMVKTAHYLFSELLRLANKQRKKAYSEDAISFRASIIPPGGLGAIGYGYLYLCKVQNVIFGNLTDKDFTIIILASDKKIVKLLESENYPIEIDILAIKHKADEKSKHFPITGFVDKNMTSWKIVSIVK